jgi:Flp pilus assembly protein TadG
MKKEKGQALVETALVVPILILFICMIIDTGRIIYAESKLNLVCQESTRIASFGGGYDEIYNYAYSKLDSNSATTLKVSMSPDVSLRTSGNNVTVDLSVDLQYITPLAKLFFTSPFNVKAESTIRIE